MACMEREVPEEPEARRRPSLPELARTAVARAAAATVRHAGPGHSPAAVGPVPVRSDAAGSPVLLAAADSALEQQLELAARPGAVIVSVPAAAPYSALTLTGAVRPLAHDRAAGLTAHALAVQSVEFAGAVPAPVPLADYRAAAPDPLWREAPGVLRHLEHGHMSDLVCCVRAHGLPLADWVIPRGLDRYGLELLVLAAGGVETIRLSFPGGPVTSLEEAPASIRVALTCRCQSAPDHLPGRPPGG
jgi:hypothetical protein